MNERWMRIGELFEAARALPVDQRETWLRSNCDDEDISAEVRALLGAYDEDPAFLEQPVGARVAGAALQSAASVPLEGRQFGPYRLVREIGRGGMGVVYEAEQTDAEFSRRVAIKLVPHAWGHPSLTTRFRLERQILAALEHPFIARLIDVGTTGDGAPFLIMEKVEGVPIDRYCADHALSVPARVRLVLDVCSAVEYAHRHFVVHRDLKPGNIFVTADGRPKLLDFGIAKLIDAQRAGSDSPTGTVARILTPECASPEQVQGLPVSAGTDVYALGVLLYRLLTEQSPYGERPMLESAMLRAICESEPVRPSAVSTREGRGSFRRQLRGDLDTIVLTALRKDPRDRYASVEQLSQDLRNYLEGRPILARKPTLRYRAAKFLGRHAVAATLSALMLVALTAAMIWINAARVEERRQHELAERALGDAYVAQARAQRLSGRPGQRLGTLDAVAKAVALGRLTPQRKLELRNEVIAASALVDVRHVWTRQFKLGHEFACFDRTLERYAVLGTNALSIRRASDGAELARVPLPTTERRWHLTEFSPDGRYLTVFARGTPALSQVWNLTTGERLLETPGSPPAFNPDSRRLAVCDPAGGVALYDVASSNLVARFAPGVKCGSAAFGGRGKWLALHAPGAGKTPDQVIVLDAASGAESGRVRLGGRLVRFAWHPNGRHVAVSSDDQRGAIQIYDWTTGALVKRLSGHAHFVVDLAINEQGSLLASSSWDSTIRLWSISAGRELLRIPAGGLPRFAPDGRQMGIQGWDREALSLFALAPLPPEVRSFELDTDPHDGGEAIAYNANGRLLVHTGGAPGRDLILRDAATLETLAVLTNQSHSLVLADATGEGFFSAQRQILRLPLMPGPLSDGSVVGRLPAYPLVMAKLSNDGRWLAGADADSQILLADLRSETPLRRLGEHAQARFIAVSPDGRWVATGAWILNGVKVWNVEQGRLERDLPTESMANVMFSPDGQWLVTTSERIAFWRVGSWEAARHIARPPLERYPSPMGFTRDGRVLALCPNSRAIRLVDTATGDELATLELANPWWIRGLSFSPDGSQLAVSGELTREFSVWDLRRLRTRLAAMQLDWDLPPYPPPAR